MAAVGLIPEYRIADEDDDGGLSARTFLAQLVEFVFGLREKLQVCHDLGSFLVLVRSQTDLETDLETDLDNTLAEHQRELVQLVHAPRGRQRRPRRGGRHRRAQAAVRHLGQHRQRREQARTA